MSEYSEKMGQLPPEITPGKIVHQTAHYQVVTDFKPGMEGKPKGARFFIEPKSDGVPVFMLFNAAETHNIYDFTIRPIATPQGTTHLPTLRVNYTAANVSPLMYGKVDVPSSYAMKDSTVPSPDHMELCMDKKPPFQAKANYYFFVEGATLQIPNPMTRRLHLLLNAFSDEIPPQIIHGNNNDRYRKVRKNWFNGVVGAMESGMLSGEFANIDLIGRVEQFLDYVTSYDFKHKLLTTEDDIKWANALIREIIG